MGDNSTAQLEGLVNGAGADDYRLLAKIVTPNGSKVWCGGPGIFNGYTVNPNQLSYDQPLALGDFPYNQTAVASIQKPAGRELDIFNPDSSVSLADTSIRPTAAFYLGNTIYATGTDNNSTLAHGGARATVYNVGPNSSQLFAVSTPNTLVSGVSTLHSNLWGSVLNTRNFLVTNSAVHSGSGIAYTYTVRLYDGTGHLLRTSATATGCVTQISVGGVNDVYVRGTNGADGGIFVASYTSTCSQRWVKSIACVNLAGAGTHGVIVGDNEIDGTGHRHVHLTKYSEAGSQLWILTYATDPNNEDYLYQLQFWGGKIYFTGQAAPAGGNKYIFAARYDQTTA